MQLRCYCTARWIHHGLLCAIYNRVGNARYAIAHDDNGSNNVSKIVPWINEEDDFSRRISYSSFFTFILYCSFLLQLNVNFERNLFLFDAISLSNFRIIGRKNQRQRENKSIILLIFYYYFFFLKEISNLKFKTSIHLLIIPQLFYPQSILPKKKNHLQKSCSTFNFPSKREPLPYLPYPLTIPFRILTRQWST